MTDPITGMAHLLSQGFIDRAFVLGTPVAVACGLVGYFVVLRAQVFTGDALSHVAFTGALAALAAGIDLRIGLFAGCVLFSAAMAALGSQGRPDDVVIGNTFAWILGLGVLFLALYATSGRGGDARAGPNVLFGSIFGLSQSETILGALIAVAVVVIMAVLARPLLFASIDEAVAAARGVPVRLLGVGFLIVVGVTAGEATQAVGAMLLLGLLSAPAATAQALTDRPWMAITLSVVLAVTAMWAGITVSYAAPDLPVSFSIIGVATVLYLAAVAGAATRRRHRPAVVSEEPP
ncbi:MAG: metal ABC transporter permease [Actinomycetota bacterium]|nr:metal ABC transporter permease [Actinomycetota bacterium]